MKNHQDSNPTEYPTVTAYTKQLAEPQAQLVAQLRASELVNAHSQIASLVIADSIADSHSVIISKIASSAPGLRAVLSLTDFAPTVFIGLSAENPAPPLGQPSYAPPATSAMLNLIAVLDSMSSVDDSLKDNKIVILDEQNTDSTEITACALVELNDFMPELDNDWTYDEEAVTSLLVIPISLQTAKTIKESGRDGFVAAWKNQHREWLGLELGPNKNTVTEPPTSEALIDESDSSVADSSIEARNTRQQANSSRREPRRRANSGESERSQYGRRKSDQPEYMKITEISKLARKFIHLQGKRQVIGETIVGTILLVGGSVATVVLATNEMLFTSIVPACFAVGGIVTLLGALKESKEHRHSQP